MEGELSLKRCLGHCCPELNQLHVPLNARVVRNAVWSHFERFTCHAEDEIVSRTQCSMDDEDSVPVLTCQFSRDGLGGHLLATGDEQGQVLLMDTRKRAQQSVIEEFMAHRNAIHEVCWNRNGSELVTASADNTIKLWDINCSCKELSTLRGHQGTVKSVDVHREEPTIIVSGGRDGIVAVWDTRYNNRGTHHSPLRISQCQYTQAVTRMRFRAFVQKESIARHSVSAVRFLGDHGILTSGINGVIKLWDKRLLSEVYHTFEAPVKLGITAIALDTSHTQMFASCKDSKIYTFDCTKFLKTPIARYSGHTVSSYYVKLALSPDDRYLLSGSANVGLYSNGGHIWEVNNREGADYDMSPLVMLPGQGGEVTGVAWCPSQLSKIVTCSDNHDTWIWRTSNDSSDKIIAHCQQHGARGYLRVRPPKTPTPMPSPSNCSQQTVDVDEDKAVMKNKDQINNWSSEVTTLVTSPPIKCINSGCTNGGSGSDHESRKRGIPLDCITNNNTLLLSLPPKRKATVKHTKQVTLEKILLEKPTPSPSNCSQQTVEVVVMKNKDQTNNWSSEVTTPVTSPPIKCINSGCCTNGGSGSESRKRGIPLDCITNNNTSSLSLTPKRKVTVKRTKQVTLETLLQKE